MQGQQAKNPGVDRLQGGPALEKAHPQSQGSSCTVHSAGPVSSRGVLVVSVCRLTTFPNLPSKSFDVRSVVRGIGTGTVDGSRENMPVVCSASDSHPSRWKRNTEPRMRASH